MLCWAVAVSGPEQCEGLLREQLPVLVQAAGRFGQALKREELGQLWQLQLWLGTSDAEAGSGDAPRLLPPELAEACRDAWLARPACKHTPLAAASAATAVATNSVAPPASLATCMA